jgi:hypothetical protein
MATTRRWVSRSRTSTSGDPAAGDHVTRGASPRQTWLLHAGHADPTGIRTRHIRQYGYRAALWSGRSRLGSTPADDSTLGEQTARRRRHGLAEADLAHYGQTGGPRNGHRPDLVVRRYSPAAEEVRRARVRTPLAKKLIAVARSAMFGRGEETLSDANVRDKWELTPDQITLGGPGWTAPDEPCARTLS